MSKSLYRRPGLAAAIAILLLVTACGDRKGAADNRLPPAKSPSTTAEKPSLSRSPSSSGERKQTIIDSFHQQA